MVIYSPVHMHLKLMNGDLHGYL